MKGKQESRGRSSWAKRNEIKGKGATKESNRQDFQKLSLTARELIIKQHQLTLRTGSVLRGQQPLWHPGQGCMLLLSLLWPSAQQTHCLPSLSNKILSLYKDSNCLASQYVCNIEPMFIKYLLCCVDTEDTKMSRNSPHPTRSYKISHGEETCMFIIQQGIIFY